MQHHIQSHRPGLVLLLLMFMLGGCGGGSTAVRYYLVDPVQYNDIPANTNPALAIEILEVQVPQYLEEFHIATRRQANQLHFTETSQWGENLRKNLLRTLARNLSVLLESNDVATPLNRSMSIPDYRIQVHIEQFERDSDGTVRLIAGWQVSGKATNGLIFTLKADLQGSGYIAEDDFDSIVAEMQKLFGQLSQQIADSVRAAASNPGGQVGT